MESPWSPTTPQQHRAEVALGIRIELYLEDTLVGAPSRQDVTGPGVPSAGDFLNPYNLNEEIHDVIGGHLQIHHVEHFLRVPHTQEHPPVATMVIHGFCERTVLAVFFGDTAVHRDLDLAGWHLSDLRLRDERCR